MNKLDLILLKNALACVLVLSDSDNWYDETPKGGGSDVPAWRGPVSPEALAEKAATWISAIISCHTPAETVGPSTSNAIMEGGGSIE